MKTLRKVKEAKIAERKQREGQSEITTFCFQYFCVDFSNDNATFVGFSWLICLESLGFFQDASLPKIYVHIATYRVKKQLRLKLECQKF